MKNLLLIIGVVFLSLNVSAQNGWVTGKSVITGQKYIYKQTIIESGDKSKIGFKIWKEGDSYYYDLIIMRNKESFISLRDYKVTHQVRINGEWKTFWNNPMLEKSPIFDYTLKDIKAGDMLKLDIGIGTVYLDLSGSTAAINSL